MKRFMQENNFLKTQLTQRTGIVNGITKSTITNKDGKTYEKIVIEFTDPSINKSFKASDVKFDKEDNKCNTLWYNQSYEESGIPDASTLGRFLAFYGASNLADMISKKVFLTNDNKGYIVFVAYNSNAATPTGGFDLTDTSNNNDVTVSELFQ